MKKIVKLGLIFILLFVKALVYIESAILNHFTETRGDGILFRFWLWGNRVKSGKRFFSYYPFYLYGRGNLLIGDYCSFGEFTKIWNFEEIIIGDDFMAAEGLTILTGGHDPDTLTPICKRVVIGNRVWCGANVTIMPGVTIGDDVVIGAGSLVTKDISKESIVAGVPGRIIRNIDMEQRNLSFYCRRKLFSK
jgi:acetyltransferase-like isoleucine patch superfamily enzyme